uniref:(northern house mosquito) hypothetical protein n=1 Tax=Culex pipiens TaxID=7175 RepID=A0A8D8CM04_CULPI
MVLDDTLDLAPGRFVLALVQLSDRIQDGIAIQRFAPSSVLVVDTWPFIALDRIVFRCSCTASCGMTFLGDATAAGHIGKIFRRAGQTVFAGRSGRGTAADHDSGRGAENGIARTADAGD